MQKIVSLCTYLLVIIQTFRQYSVQLFTCKGTSTDSEINEIQSLNSRDKVIDKNKPGFFRLARNYMPLGTLIVFVGEIIPTGTVSSELVCFSLTSMITKKHRSQL